MKARLNSRKLRLESLEERTLLAVTAGVTEQAAEIAAPTGAENWIVNTTADPSSWDADDTIISLREAIARAAAGDTVTFAPSLAGGTITLNGTELEITKGMTIDAASIGGMTINADGKSRVFNVSGGNSSNSVELISLTISGGSTDDGGGIINSGSLKLTGSTVTNNSATRYGGGIYNSGTLNVASSTISGNSSEDVGGGIFNSGTLNVASSTISDNSSEDSGGGIYNSGTLNVASSTISDNSSEDSGGGIFNFGTLNVTNSTVSGNVAIYIYEYNGKVWQYGEGGGIYSDYDSTLTVINSAIFGNTAGSYGGGVYWYASSTGTSVTIINTTISGNSVLREDGCGGGIYAGDYDAEPTLINTIVSFNYSSF
ncbi:MAG: hypothetical protein J6S40_07785, partial [Thermoguttaceae bacterium]|nr:hypothetical protein [Thermoguttaceae bacterium]